jgi:DNA-binding MarR family transcriptional regulator
MTHPPDRLLQPERQAEFLLYRLYRIHITAGRKVVQMCEARHGMTQRAMLDRARTSRTLTSLAGKRLIERRPKPHDRREVQVFLSEDGRRVHDDIFPRIAAINQALVAELTPDERRALDRIVDAVQASADRLLGDDPPLARDNPDDEP